MTENRILKKINTEGAVRIKGSNKNKQKENQRRLMEKSKSFQKKSSHVIR